MAERKYEEWITEEGLFLIEGWAKRGLSKADIAHNIGITAGTLSEWQNTYPEIKEAIKSGKQVIDIMVENALVKSALGFEYEEVTQELTAVPKRDEEGNIIPGLFEDLPQLGVTKKVKKVQPPNATSMIFYLKNKLPEHFRDRREMELSGDIGHKQGVDVSGIKTEDLKQFADDLRASLKAGDSDGGSEQGKS